MIAEQIKNLLPAIIHPVVYIGELPSDTDDTCIALTEAGGPHGTYFAKDRMDTPYLKVTVRDIDSAGIRSRETMQRRISRSC